MTRIEGRRKTQRAKPLARKRRSPKCSSFRWLAPVLLTLGVGLIQPLLAARELSEDELRMKERVIALSQGEGAVADLQIEVLDGTAMTLSGNRIDHIADGKVTSQVWDYIGSPVQRDERTVTDDEVRKLLGALVEKKYWTFQGTKFIPDFEEFMFRFHYKNLQPVEYRCQAHEYQQSQPLSAIRSVLLSFVSGSSPVEQPVTR